MTATKAAARGSIDRAIRAVAAAYALSEEQEAELNKRLRKSYTIYGCMLLLPPTADLTDQSLALTAEQRERLYEAIVEHLKITHIALNKPIPPLESNHSSENILRAPINFTPLFGDFGPSTCASPPSPEAFSAAFWVTTRQNGIQQTWAPRWTMFSRGNISEKARLLDLLSVTRAMREGRETGSGSAAVDLYAGIGYFAFSYVRAGISKVLCWDLNPWSIEGLRRGAKANKWSVVLWDDGCGSEEPPATLQHLGKSDAELLVFNESNASAPSRIKEMRTDLPPIRHINCGMLPSSRDSLRLAAEILDARHDGWVHIHENFAVSEIEQKAEETRAELQSLLAETRAGTGSSPAAGRPSVNTEIETVYRLKSYAPGVMHCVIDIRVAASTLQRE